MEIKLGKIQNVKFGFGGYQDAMIGISFTLEGSGWGVCDFWGQWSIERSKNAQWTEEDRLRDIGKTGMRIAELLKKSKVQSIDKLKDKPIEVTFENMTLKSWRILEEVL